MRHAVDAGLEIRGARLSSSQHDRCVQFCLQKCWEMSGLQGDGKSLRYVWKINGFIAPAGALDEYVPLKIRPFTNQRSAELALEDLRARKRIAFASIDPVRPRGAYDPESGLTFSTYSWRLIVNHRIDDWYRSDPEFGDLRYASNRREEESLEALASRHQDDDGGSIVDLPVPLGRLEVIDQLNAHAYMDAGEEVLTREAFGFRS